MRCSATSLAAFFMLFLASCGSDHNPVGGANGTGGERASGGTTTGGTSSGGTAASGGKGGITPLATGGSNPTGSGGSGPSSGGTAVGGQVSGGASTGGGGGGRPTVGGTSSGGAATGGMGTGGVGTGGVGTGGVGTGGVGTGGVPVGGTANSAGTAGIGGGYPCGSSRCVSGQYCLYNGAYSCEWIPSCCPGGVDCDCLLNSCNLACTGTCTGTYEEGFNVVCSGNGGTGGAGGSGGEGPYELCTRTGGTVTTASCCGSASDFPNLCLDGPCGCAPANSHEINVCSCPVNECFDGTGCVAR